MQLASSVIRRRSVLSEKNIFVPNASYRASFRADTAASISSELWSAVTDTLQVGMSYNATEPSVCKHIP